MSGSDVVWREQASVDYSRKNGMDPERVTGAEMAVKQQDLKERNCLERKGSGRERRANGW